MVLGLTTTVTLYLSTQRIEKKGDFCNMFQGRFTAPIDGEYLFYWTDETGKKIEDHFYMRKNEIFLLPKDAQHPFGWSLVWD